VKRWLTVSSLVILLFAVTVSQAMAADFRSGTDVTIPVGEVVNDDLYVSGATVNIAGTINGSLFVGAGTTNVTGTVTGDVNVAGGQVSVTGPISGSVRIAGGTLTVSSKVGRDVVMAGGTLDLAAGSVVGRDLVVNGGMGTVAGTVGRRLQGSIGQLTIQGKVMGDVDIRVGTLTLDPTAHIGGNLHYESNNQADIRSGATVVGTTTRTLPPENQRPAAESFWEVLVGRIRSIVAPLVLGVILLLLAPRTIPAVAAAIGQHPWRTVGWGALVLIVTPLVGLIVLIAGLILGGASISLIIFALYTVLIVIASVFVGLFIGERLLGLWRRDFAGFSYWALALGLVILAILSVIPYLNILATILTLFFGVGAVVFLTIRGLGRARREGVA
jgi:hypothetical protein